MTGVHVQAWHGGWRAGDADLPDSGVRLQHDVGRGWQSFNDPTKGLLATELEHPLQYGVSHHCLSRPSAVDPAAAVIWSVDHANGEQCSQRRSPSCLAVLPFNWTPEDRVSMT